VPFTPRATPKDIFYCFRLLLGRHPNPEEWRGHAMRAGEDLRGVVASFAGSLECTRRGFFNAGPRAAASAIEIEGFSILTAADDASIGRAVRAGSYEPEIVALLRRLVRPGMGVLDLGANIGFFTLLSATLVGPRGHVFAVEPNPRNARLLEASRRMNGFNQVSVLQVAAAAAHGLLVLNTSYSNGTTAGLPDNIAAVLACETVPAVRIDDLLPGDRPIDVIKVDVEGAEYIALRGCAATIRRDRPVIVSEFSPGQMPGISGIDGPGYLRWLMDLGYRISVVCPDATLLRADADIDLIMAAYNDRASDHIDLLAEPA
jgi:FkbM family methyltransferase